MIPLNRSKRMQARILCLLATTLLLNLSTIQDGWSEEVQDNYEMPLIDVKIGIVTDGPLISTPDLVENFQREILQVTEGEFNVSFPKSMMLEADSTQAGVNKHFDTLLDNPDTDLILALGTVASSEAMKRQDPVKPIIAPFIFDAELQKAPREDRGSGVANLFYIDLQAPIDYELITFRKLVPIKKLAVLFTEREVNGIPAIKKLTSYLANEHSIDVQLVPVNSSASEAIAQLENDTDGVMVGPLWLFTREEITQLSKQLIGRGLPSFSMSEYAYVEAGLFATTMPDNTVEHLARQVSISIQEILLGEDPATLPVIFTKSQKLAINMATARAINVYPSLEYTTGSTLLNEQRDDIDRKVNLMEVVNEALAANLDLAVAEREVTAGSYAVGEARSVLLPQIGVGLGGRVIDDDRAAVGFGTSPEKAWTASASAVQLLYSEDGWTGYTVEKHRQSGREFDRDRVRLDTIFNASVAYFNVLRSKTIEQLQKDNMLLTQANLERAQIRLGTGVAGPDELYRWQTQFANDRQVVLKAESETIDAMQSLNRILDRPLQEEFIAMETDLSDPLLITGDRLFYELMHNPLYLKKFNSFAVQEGLDASPELQVLDAAIEAQARLLLKSKRDYWLPTFSLEAGVDQLLSDSGEGQRNEELTGLDDTDWSVGVFATLPLIEGGRKSSNLGRNREQLGQLKTERRATAERISQRILQSLNNTRASYPSINLSRDAKDAARRNLQLVTDSYVQGIKSIIDLLDAQNQALNAELDAANAVYNFLIDLMGVQRSIGNFIIFLPENEKQQWLEETKTFLQAKK